MLLDRASNRYSLNLQEKHRAFIRHSQGDAIIGVGYTVYGRHYHVFFRGIR